MRVAIEVLEVSVEEAASWASGVVFVEASRSRFSFMASACRERISLHLFSMSAAPGRSMSFSLSLASYGHGSNVSLFVEVFEGLTCDWDFVGNSNRSR